MSMSDERSQPELLARPGLWLALAAAFAGGCATGVDVTDAELEEICAEPNASCGGGAAGASVGSVGGSTAVGAGGSTGSANGGTFSATGGTGVGTANGGTGSAVGGTGGAISSTGGTGGTGATQPLAQGECLPADDILILYRNRAAGASANEPSMVLSVQNPGGASFALNTLAIRYWFTADGSSNFTSNIDYATLNGQGNLSSSISVTFGQEFGSDYAEITFSSTDSVDAEGVQEVQLRFHSEPYQNLDQTNDFSFLQGATAAMANRNVTPYLNGMQVGGCVPSH
jgi:endoglucanase